MADRSTPLLLEGLSRAVAEPAGLPLVASRATPGLFTNTSASKQAAQRGKDEGLLRVVRTETRGKSTQEVCAITEKGLAYLLHQVSPRQVLEDFVRALQSRQAQTGELLDVAHRMREELDALRTMAEKVLQQVQQPTANGHASDHGPEPWPMRVLEFLTHWQTSGTAEDCALPALFAQAQAAAPRLTIGQFHDGLRRLHDQEQIYLHPWTGPLYEIPEPSYALLVGHEVAYYASIRSR